MKMCTHQDLAFPFSPCSVLTMTQVMCLPTHWHLEAQRSGMFPQHLVLFCELPSEIYLSSAVFALASFCWHQVSHDVSPLDTAQDGFSFRIHSPVDFDLGTREYPLNIEVSDGTNSIDISGTIVVAGVNEHPTTFGGLRKRIVQVLLFLLEMSTLNLWPDRSCFFVLLFFLMSESGHVQMSLSKCLDSFFSVHGAGRWGHGDWKCSPDCCGDGRWFRRFCGRPNPLFNSFQSSPVPSGVGVHQRCWPRTK